MSIQVTLAQENNTTKTNVTNNETIFNNAAPSIAPSSSVGTTISPSSKTNIPVIVVPTTSLSPTINYDEICPNSVDWKRMAGLWPWEKVGDNLEFNCDDEEVGCSDFGTLGRADLHCCKCRPMCCGRCNVSCIIIDDDDNGTMDHPSPSTTQPHPPPPTFSPGYKYKFKGNSSSSSSSSSWNFRPGPRHGALVIVVFFVSVIWCCNREQQSLRRTRRTMNHRRRQQQNGNNNNTSATTATAASEDGGDEISEERYQLFVSRFHFETVPSESDGRKEENSPDSLVRENSASSSKAETSIPDDGQEEEEEDNEQKTKDVEDEVMDLENSSLQRIHSSATLDGIDGYYYQPFASLKRIPAKGECSICLDGYHPGEIICIAINQACNHVYHQECVVEWLKTNDRCPLCRVDLMK